MAASSFVVLVVLAVSSAVRAQTYSATYTYNPNNPDSLPATTEQGQAGTNQCGTGSNQESLCQNLFINSITDFCLWGPPYANQSATIGETERIEVAWCLKSGYGTRLLPDGTIVGAHWVETPDYVQVTGWGDFTKIGIPASDAGGELDPHGADGNGNPIGGLVFGNTDGTMIQYHEWTNFMSATEFCIRACKPSGTNPAGLCQHIYDIMGCEWNMPGNYDQGYFDSCMGDTGLPMGVYGGSTFQQGDGATPAPHPAPASSDCVRVASLTSFAPAPTGPVATSISIATNGSQIVTYLFTNAPTTSSSSTPAPTIASSTSKSATSTTKANAAHANVAGPMTAMGLAIVMIGVAAVL